MRYSAIKKYISTELKLNRSVEIFTVRQSGRTKARVRISHIHGPFIRYYGYKSILPTIYNNKDRKKDQNEQNLLSSYGLSTRL